MMPAMANSPPRVLATTVVTIACALAPAPAQELLLADVMRRAHGFVVEYEDDLSMVVAEEHYEQRVLDEDGDLEEQRVLISDYRVTQLLPHEFWFGVREVFEVDGAAVAERTTPAHRALRLSPGEDTSERLTHIAEENARFNIGDVVRTFNEPTFALAFLHPRNRNRMRFVHIGEERVGELSTWVVGYREIPVDGTSFIETRDGNHLLTRGRFWIDPTNGRVARSELITGDGRVERTARITVDYRLFPTLNLWLPAQMHEVYETTSAARQLPIITGTATYSNYRMLTPAVASLTVAWDSSPDSNVVGYIIQWGETSGIYTDATDVGNVTQARVDGLVEAQRYYVVVRSYTAAGTRSIPSEEASGLAVTSSAIEQQ